ncbi:PAS domain S-box protein [Romboutsia weinsteinii]|uniref:PAS domain S-box protein n=1 Tax=Romboutsia weinsteinii TaxID=2020949 RepID=A0A371J9N1_9FIRM|nr:sigma 54-interacting transcriptional regulator [Romboutsia weinsteinii]RDY29482.1 PAS domain S-box protein [Romboutsia weinsteinii]
MIHDIEFYKKVLETSHDEICVIDKNSTIIYCNKSFEENYGIKRDDIIGKNVSYLMESGYATQSPIQKVIDTKSQISLEQETSTGKKLIITATPRFDEDNQIEFIVENCRDITELINIKNKLEDTKKQVKKYKHEVESLYRTTLKQEDNIIMNGSVMKPIMHMANQISKTDVVVLLLGESGTGKSSLARHIHHKSNRSKGPFITINCSTISPHLLESELFGYAPGAFTGANSKGKIGLVELANEGTLFLDEIGELPKDLQVRFLQFIQDKTFTPVGAIREKKVDVRIISATNVNLLEKVHKKKFREDLYYRLNVVQLKLPPLRNRNENLVELIKYYFNKYSRDFNFNKTISPEAIDVISKYNFPGNIRELQNIIQSILITCSFNHITTKDLPNLLFSNMNMDDFYTNNNEYNQGFDVMMDEYEKNIILTTYNKYRSSYKVAKELKISQSRASRLIRKYTSDY